MITFSTKTTINTSRLLLRPLQPDDTHTLYNIMSDHEVTRYWKTEPWKSIEQAYTAIEQAHKGLLSGKQLTLGLIRKSDNTLIGTAMLFNIVKASRRAELGYSLATRTQGKGYMQETLQTLIKFAFEELHLNRLEASIDPRNINSAKALIKQGFHQDGYLKQHWIINGEISDSTIYGLLSEEWQQKQKAKELTVVAI